MNGFSFEVKHFDEKIERYGIDGGRIIKLIIRDPKSNKSLCAYERGWEVKPISSNVKKAYMELLAEYN